MIIKIKFLKEIFELVKLQNSKKNNKGKIKKWGLFF